jgi:hypothetical protein
MRIVMINNMSTLYDRTLLNGMHYRKNRTGIDESYNADRTRRGTMNG